MYTKQVLPTTLYGINFRSRLEAQWAVFFNLQKWKWVYEPFELNGLVPDFLVSVKTTDGTIEDAICEVKPSIFIDDFLIDRFFTSYKEYVIKSKTLFLLCTEKGFQKLTCNGESGIFHTLGDPTEYLGFDTLKKAKNIIQFPSYKK